MKVKFTQYMRPYGTPKEISTEVPDSLKRYVDDLVFTGAKFEAEVLQNGEVSFTIEYEKDDEEIETLAHEICSNDESVAEALNKLIRKAWDALQQINME